VSIVVVNEEAKVATAEAAELILSVSDTDEVSSLSPFFSFSFSFFLKGKEESEKVKDVCFLSLSVYIRCVCAYLADSPASRPASKISSQPASQCLTHQEETQCLTHQGTLYPVRKFSRVYAGEYSEGWQRGQGGLIINFAFLSSPLCFLFLT
jgi:hypothetical protein